MGGPNAVSHGLFAVLSVVVGTLVVIGVSLSTGSAGSGGSLVGGERRTSYLRLRQPDQW
jgi:hypothetical protein